MLYLDVVGSLCWFCAGIFLVSRRLHLHLNPEEKSASENLE